MSLDGLFDPATLRAQGDDLLGLFAEHLSRSLAGSCAVKPDIAPADAFKRWESASVFDGGDDFLSIAERVLKESTALHHPGWVGHQVAPPSVAAILGDFVGALLNNGMATFEVGPAAVAIEARMVRWMCDALGMPPKSGGVFTSGGSLGNLTALLAMRQRASRFDAWRDGAHAGPPATVLVSEHAHYSVKRAVQVMGWGEAGAWPVQTDDALRLDPGALPRALADARRAGRAALGVVANACNTALGTFDPVARIADFCEREGLWLHVDGAHGAAAAITDKYAHLVDGVQRADSVVWDAHKMLLTPAMTTGVLYRDADAAYDAFAQDASYLFRAGGKEEIHHPGHRTLECTKRMAALRLFAVLAVYGEKTVAGYVERQFDLARSFAGMLEDAEGFELAAPPESNIVCFRFAPTGLPADKLDSVQDAVREAINKEGDFYLSRTELPRGVHLRVTLMHPCTTTERLAELLDRVRKVADAAPALLP